MITLQDLQFHFHLSKGVWFLRSCTLSQTQRKRRTGAPSSSRRTAKSSRVTTTVPLRAAAAAETIAVLESSRTSSEYQWLYAFLWLIMDRFQTFFWLCRWGGGGLDMWRFWADCGWLDQQWFCGGEFGNSMQIMMYALAVLNVLITISFCHCLKTEMLTFDVSIFLFSTTAWFLMGRPGCRWR